MDDQAHTELVLSTARTAMELVLSTEDIAARVADLATKRHRALRRWNQCLVALNVLIMLTMIGVTVATYQIVNTFMQGISHLHTG